jgi:hypothetical protein
MEGDVANRAPLRDLASASYNLQLAATRGLGRGR